jgi:hypothetical protein
MSTIDHFDHKITGTTSTTDVSLVVSTPSFAHAVPKSIIIQKVSGSQATPLMTIVYIYATRTHLATG